MRFVAALALTVITAVFLDQAPAHLVNGAALVIGGMYVGALAVGLFVTRWRP